jgi:hypothetical protein
MAAWDRQTPWRQGHVLTSDTCVALGLFPGEKPTFEFAVVVSHDCDLARLPDSEPLVEVILARRVEQADGNYTLAKNSRKLHLSYVAGGVRTHVDLIAQAKTTIPKVDLAHHAPCEVMVLEPKEKCILQQWLAARYARAVFPDEFVTRLEPIKKKLEKILAASESHLWAVLFDVDGGDEIERTGDEDVYSLRAFLVYKTDENPEVAQAAAEKAAASIVKLFRERYLKPPESWTLIELEYCDPVSDEAVTYAQASRLKKFEVDFLTNAANQKAA